MLIRSRAWLLCAALCLLARARAAAAEEDPCAGINAPEECFVVDCSKNPNHPLCAEDPLDPCVQNPADEVCQLAAFCAKNPDHQKCQGEDFCASNPTDPACTDPPADPPPGSGNGCKVGECEGIDENGDGIIDVMPGGVRPCSTCSSEVAPVCSTNGKIYDNSCKASCAKQSKYVDCGTRSKAACWADCKKVAKEGCKCGMAWQPTCGKDGKIYSNQCFANCKSTARFACGSKDWNACKAACTQDAQSGCFCPEVYAPVCTTAGTVISNACKAGCLKKPVRWPCGNRKNCARDCRAAAAPKPPAANKCSKCSREWKPVCAWNGKVYMNECQARCAGKRVRFACGKLMFTKCTSNCRRRMAA